MTTPIKEEEDLGYEPAKMEMANTVLVDASKNDDGTTRDLNKHCKYVFGAGSGFGGVVHRLGRGGQGDVFLAQDVRTGRFNIALKIVSIENGANRVDLAREVELYKSLNKQAESEFIVMMKDFFVIEMEGGLVKSVAMSFKYHEQGSLQDFADFNGGKLDIADVKTAVRCVARALQTIHEKGFAHRDLKPDNCLVECDLYGKLVIVRLCDLGLVRRIKGDSYCEDLTANVGTPGYQSPYNATGQAYDPAKNDVFGLGALAFRIKTGRKLNSMVYAVAGDGRRTTKAARRADATAKKLIIQEQDVLKAELGIEMPNEIIKCLYTTEAKCPKLADVLNCDFLTEDVSASITDGVAMIELSNTKTSETELDFSRMLVASELNNETKLSGLVPWAKFLSNPTEMGAPFFLQALFVEFWNRCVGDIHDLSFTGIFDFLELLGTDKSPHVSEFLRSPSCTTRNPRPYNAANLGVSKSISAKWRKGAQGMAKAIKNAVEDMINELNDAGESLQFDDLYSIVTTIFSEAAGDAVGFKDVADRKCRMFCRLLFAIHLHHVESEEEIDADDGDSSDKE